MDPIVETPPEEAVQKADAPILHSMKRDIISGAKTIVGSNDVPAEEAVLLAKMQEASLKKRKLSSLTILGVLIVLIGVGIFILPDKVFLRKDPGITVIKNKTQNFLSTDAEYSIDKPTESELETFKEKAFTGKVGISSIVIKNGGVSTEFKDLDPLVKSRLISNLIPLSIQNYLYGFFTNSKSVSSPYFIFEITDQYTAEALLLEQERILYTDIGNILLLPDNSGNELLQFEPYDSIRVPMRQLRNRTSETLIVYGFPTDSTVLFTTSIESYIALRNRMLLGY